MYRKPRRNLCKGLSLLLCLVVLLTSVHFGGMAALAEENGTVTVTVNYVYASNQSMVAQPYQAQLTKGASFRKTLEAPKLLNYSIPADKAVGLQDGIVLSKSDSGNYTLDFNLESVQENITVTLYYVAGSAKYLVKHFYQKLESDEYEEPITVEMTGDIDAYTAAVANTKPGFRCKGVPQTTIAADGTTIVEIYYDREYYTVIFDVNGGIDGPEPIYAKYGTKFNVADIKQPRREGYTFLGWDEPAISDEVEITENVTYTAQWQANRGQADYTIVLWGQNANDDEYSYLSSYEAWGNVGNTIAWNDSTRINHVHTEECGAKYCKLEEHTHSAECGLNFQHVHDFTCYGGMQSKTPDVQDIKQFSALLGSLQNGDIYRVRCEAGSMTGDTLKYEEYYLYFNGTCYSTDAASCDGSYLKTSGKINAHSHSGYIFSGNDKDQFWVYTAKQTCTHHTDACYSCGKIEHTHSQTCCGITNTADKFMRDICPDTALWVYDHSDTVTVNADGSTVLNVYFNRTVFTLSFRKARSNNNDYGTIAARWGKNIQSEYAAVVAKAGSSFWSRNRDASEPWTNYIGIMPKENTIYYRRSESGSSSTMYYYGEDLNGKDQLIFSVTFKGSNLSVTAEDRYEFEGFTCDLSRSTKVGSSCNGAKFYYTRNSYNLEFYSASASTPDKTETPKYQQPLGSYDYTPTAKPDTVEPDAVFVGWYQNPECTGEPYDLSAHTMPANNIALYAKWVNGLYTVRTYTDNTFETLYTYDGYTGIQDKIVKYTLASEPAKPSKDGYVFIGWFYKEDGAEKPFSFTMPITRDYDLYPKFSEPTAVTYTVHYYLAGTTKKVADDRVNSVMIGSAVTEKAKMGTELNLLEPSVQNKYYPENTSTSVIISQLDQEIVFYYTMASSVQYTVYYQDANGKDLIDPVTKTTEFSTVTETYVSIPNYAPRQYQITQDLSSDASQNKIVFIYDPTLSTLTITKTGAESIDENQTFVFHIQGTDNNTKDIDLTVTVHGNSSTTVSDLPVGSYTVTEQTDWSWRYTPEAPTQAVTVDSDGAVVTFKNVRSDSQWLNGDSYRSNGFTGKEGNE